MRIRLGMGSRPFALLLGTAMLGCSPAAPLATVEAPATARAPAASTDPPPVDFVLRPVCGTDGHPTALDVEVSLDRWGDLPPTFRVAAPEDAVPSVRELIEGPTLSDDAGELGATLSEGPDPGDHERRLFVKGARPVNGHVKLHYRARSVGTNEKGARFGLRHDENGIGGTADGFLLVPAIDVARTLRVRWVDAGCDASLRPISALGHGSAPPPLVAPPDSLRRAGFFLGHVDTVAIDDGNLHLSFSFIGRPAFDTHAAARYAADVLRAERAAFGDDDPTPFYAFMRVLPEMTRFVTGSGNAYGYTSVVGPDAPWDTRMRDHIAHELMHHWVGVGLWLRDTDGVSGYWFSEGFTVHYSRMIPLRLGLLPPTELLEQLRKLSTEYYGSPNRSASNADIEAAIDRGVGDPKLGLIPYYRGALYAAELDSAIRHASKGARSLDDVMRGLREQAKNAPKNEAGYSQLPERAFRDRVFSELGQAGVDRFDAVIRRGELADPPGDAYGPCFDRREPKPGEVEWFRIDGVPDARCVEASPP